MTFGVYHQYTTNKIMELNNEMVEIQNKYFMDKMENQHKLLNDKFEKLEKVVSQQKSWWWSQ